MPESSGTSGGARVVKVAAGLESSDRHVPVRDLRHEALAGSRRAQCARRPSSRPPAGDEGGPGSWAACTPAVRGSR